MRFSKFTHKYYCDNSVALFHSLLLKKIYLDAIEWDSLKSYYENSKEINLNANSIIQELFDEGFLVNNNEDEMLLLAAKKLLRTPELNTIFLINSENCNFACKYCFENRGNNINDKTKNMSKETAKKALTTFAKESKKSQQQREIFFYGGEPLINYDTFSFSLDHIKDLYDTGVLGSYKITLSTNGSLINPNVINDATEHNVHFSISLDGFEPIHNKYRVYRNGRGTFNSVMKGVKNLKDNNIGFGVSCTIGNHNVKQLEKITEWFITDLGCSAIGFNLPLYNKNDSTIPPIELTTEKVLKSFEIAREYGVYEDRIARQLRPFIGEYLYPYDCAGCGYQIVVTPDKKIGPCLGFLDCKKFYRNSNLEKFGVETDEFFLEWVKRTPLNMKKCESCEILGICGSGCHYNAYMKTGSVLDKDGDYCKYAKKTIEWLIKDLEKKL